MVPDGLIGILSSLGLVSKIVLVVLVVFSIVSWAVIVHKWRTFRLGDEEDARFLSLFKRGAEVEDLRRQAGRSPASSVAALYVGLLDRAQLEREGLGRERYPAGLEAEPVAPDHQYLQRVAGLILQDQITRQEAYLPFLATTGNITPFIGLLGTVMGIISAFQEIAKQGTASIAAVAPGVAEALVATAAGLFTAIPAVIAYNYFLTRIRRTAFRAEAFSVELLNVLQGRLKQVGVRE